MCPYQTQKKNHKLLKKSNTVKYGKNKIKEELTAHVRQKNAEMCTLIG